MAAEYSYVPTQTVVENENILFLAGERDCRKGYITHRSNGGVFRLKGASNCAKTIYHVHFNANIAVATGGTIPADGIAVALQEDGETIQNAIGRVTPTVAEAFFNVSLDTFIVIPCGCCVTVSVENTSDGTAIDVANANISFERIA